SFVIGLSIEEPAFNRTTTWKVLVAAKAWVSHYPILRVIIHTNNSSGFSTRGSFTVRQVKCSMVQCSGLVSALFTT
ncbi:hypothetical protein, partial [Vibrio sp. S12_S33]|uniref:hypothetical protein n=1 Tax=Vibrio sp. S12_S33 TaxID=2720223 RepID=UPI001EE2C255